MARTVWLALFCLIGLGIVGTAKLSFGDSPAAVPAAMIESARPITGAAKPDAEQNTLGKADKLPVLHGITEANSPNALLPTEVVFGESSPILPESPPEIVSRHWHDPNANSTMNRKTARQSYDSKKGNTKGDQVVARTAERKTCPDSNALLRTLNLTPGCNDKLVAASNRPAH